MTQPRFHWNICDVITGEAIRFDRILADVPCSGDGTLTKNNHLLHRWNEKFGLDLLQNANQNPYSRVPVINRWQRGCCILNLFFQSHRQTSMSLPQFWKSFITKWSWLMIMKKQMRWASVFACRIGGDDDHLDYCLRICPHHSKILACSLLLYWSSQVPLYPMRNWKNRKMLRANTNKLTMMLTIITMTIIIMTLATIVYAKTVSSMSFASRNTYADERRRKKFATWWAQDVPPPKIYTKQELDALRKKNKKEKK